MDVIKKDQKFRCFFLTKDNIEQFIVEVIIPLIALHKNRCNEKDNIEYKEYEDYFEIKHKKYYLSWTIFHYDRWYVQLSIHHPFLIRYPVKEFNDTFKLITTNGNNMCQLK